MRSGGPGCLTVTQPAVVAAAPGIQLALGGDGRTVRAAAGDVHHALPSLLSAEGRDELGLLQGPVERMGNVGALPAPPTGVCPPQERPCPRRSLTAAPLSGVTAPLRNAA